MDYTVDIKINQIEAYRADKVILSAWWHIENRSGKILHRDQAIYVAEGNGSDISDLVKAQHSAVNELSRDIAISLSKI